MLFLSLYLILVGLSVLVVNILRLDVSTTTILFAEGIILLGVYLLTGGTRSSSQSRPQVGDPAFTAKGSEQTLFFASSTVLGSSETTKYTVAFSSATIELPDDLPEIVEISCAFSDVSVILPKGRAVRVRMTTAFGECSTDEDHLSGFGTREVMLGEGVASFLSVNASFGQVSIEECPTEE
jgi:hypothetical protein